MRCTEKYSHDSIKVTPFLIFPSIFPEVEFRKAKKIQRILNELIHKVDYNNQFLRNVLKNI